jgi:hypothetical protein
MWPWEHLAVGYIAYSLGCRLVSSEYRPGAAEMGTVVLGTQFPDLIDKPLGWGTTLLPTGTSLAHSLLFAVPLTVCVILLTRFTGRQTLGYAFGVGYLLHPPADVVYSVLIGRPIGDGSFLLWPLLPAPAQTSGPVLARAEELVARLFDVIASPAGLGYLTFEILVLTAAFLLWVRDGSPGFGWLLARL